MPQFASMTKDELIEALQNCDAPGDTPVVIGYSSGVWGRILARPIDQDDEFETRLIEWSEYHRAWGQPKKPDGGAIKVLVLGLTQDQDEPDYSDEEE